MTTKLKPGMEVVYTDRNFSLIDKTEVISIDKSNGTAKLRNGILLNREILKKGYFKRAGIRSEARAYLYEKGSEGYNIYQAFLNKNWLRGAINGIKKNIENSNITLDGEWLKNLRKSLTKYVQ